MIIYVNKYDRKTTNICGLGSIDGKRYEFYLDGEAPDICVDIHKFWISDNEEAWCGKKSKQFKTFDQCVEYINKLFDDDIRNYEAVGFNY